MIDWVHLRAREWGRWQSREQSGWPRKSLLARIRDEGSVGAAIKQHGQPIPIQSMPKAILAFHRAWQALGERHRQVVAVYYQTHVGREAKAELLGTSRTRMYAVLDQAHARIAAQLDIIECEQAVASRSSRVAGRTVL